MRILLVSNNYPTSFLPYNGPFVKNAANEMESQGCQVTIFAPVSWVTLLRQGLSWLLPNTQAPNVYVPLFMSLPLTIAPSKLLFSYFNDWRMASALRRQYRKIDSSMSFDVCYCHFLPSGRASLAAFPDLPVFLTMGESDPWLYDDIYGKNWCRDLEAFTGIFVVSKSLYDYLIRKNPNLSGKMHISGNGVDTKVFAPIDKTEARQVLGFPEKEKLAVFVGNFEERKGPYRFLAACQKTGTKAAFLGSGKQNPKGDLVFHSGRVSRDRLKLWLAAADCFVLPSLSEGRSNAILEALAMGTPCVVSDCPFNTEYLSNEVAALVDPSSIDSISSGMIQAMKKKEGLRYARAGRLLAENMSHSSRIKNMLLIIRQHIDILG